MIMVVVEAAVEEVVEGVATVEAVEQEVEVKVEAVAVDRTVDKLCYDSTSTILFMFLLRNVFIKNSRYFDLSVLYC